MNTRLLIICLITISHSFAQQPGTTLWWHNKVRNIHYLPEGKDFRLAHGRMRFNRALYGTNTAFRVEAGDLPEFAMYMPGMGGNFRFGLISGKKSKWLTDCKVIKTIYRPGSMSYEVSDTLLGNGHINIDILAMADAEGMIIRTIYKNIPGNVHLFWAFGGASGKKFSRDGDIGADPESSFYLQPEYCRDNVYSLSGNRFHLSYGSGKILTEEERYGNHPAAREFKTPLAEEKNVEKELIGIFPPSSLTHIVDAGNQVAPLQFWNTVASVTPAIAGMINNLSGEHYFMICNPGSTKDSSSYKDLIKGFADAEKARLNLASRIVVSTPDPFLNTLGGALSVAADAIWEAPSYLHGAIAWRMRLNAWRGPYVADVLGWHERARMHFSSYALSQVTSPESGPVVADTALHLSRQLEKLGTSLFSSGYISRNPGGHIVAHHYDMNLVFIDELLDHFQWTGDQEYVHKMWPVLKRHLAWEKRNFDSDDDGLYDAYAAIWASDALEYSGGGVTHSSAYNYRGNKMASELAALVNENPLPYKLEADKILAAMNAKLWIPAKGYFAEYKDLLGGKGLHEAPGLWTIYHAIDEKVANPFQAYQALRYIDDRIAHIPVKAKGLALNGLYLLPTTNWMPYEWSLNNVALAENLHTALAYWQGNRTEEAFRIWKSALVESMYLSSSPGGFQQLSYYDAVRGELYRDFADGIGIAARSLVEGMYGIKPDALNDTLTIQPGWPQEWNYASLTTPDIRIDFRRRSMDDSYIITPSFPAKMNLKLVIRARTAGIKSILVNGKKSMWTNSAAAVGFPIILIKNKYVSKYTIRISWKPGKLDDVFSSKTFTTGSRYLIHFPHAFIQNIYDPQGIFSQVKINGTSLQANLVSDTGKHTAFVQLKQNEFLWWQALNISVTGNFDIISSPIPPGDGITFKVRNNSRSPVSGYVVVNEGENGFSIPLEIPALADSKFVSVPGENIIPGSNSFSWHNISTNSFPYSTTIKRNIITWNVTDRKQNMENIDLNGYFNDKVTRIFKNQYLSPRPSSPTLQLPTQGIGEWTHPLVTADINDIGLRKKAGINNKVNLPQAISFATPSDTSRLNIIFTSQWDNYPKEVTIPLTGKASHAYLLMAGSTNPMQSRFTNGYVIIKYTDESSDSLVLRNPETWWPVEQDYYEDGYAFHNEATVPLRIRLKTGEITNQINAGMNKKNIDGGSATVLDMILNPGKSLKEITLQAAANDVIIGLMSLTLVRPKL